MLTADDPSYLRHLRFGRYAMCLTLVIVTVIALVTVLSVPLDTTLLIASRGRPKQNLPAWFVMPMFVIVTSIVVASVIRGEKRDLRKVAEEGIPAWQIPFSFVSSTAMFAIFIFGQGYFAWEFFKAAGFVD